MLVPILRDSKTLDTPFGRYVMAAGVVGELGPILAMALALSTKHSATTQTAFTAVFIAVVLIVAWLLAQSSKVPTYLGLLRRTMTQSSQLPVRLAILLLGTMVVLADILGIDLALGALAAGMIISLVTRGADVHILHHKVDMIGFGVFIPIFFITSGMKLDVAAICSSTAGLALAALFFLALLLVRIPVALLYRTELGDRRSLALGLWPGNDAILIVMR